MLARNYLTYRDAVVVYAENHPLTNGTIPSTSLTLPATWLPASAWSNTGGWQYCLYMGRLSSEGKKKLEEITYCSQAYFYSQGLNTKAYLQNTARDLIAPVSVPTWKQRSYPL